MYHPTKVDSKHYNLNVPFEKSSPERREGRRVGRNTQNTRHLTPTSGFLDKKKQKDPDVPKGPRSDQNGNKDLNSKVLMSFLYLDLRCRCPWVQIPESKSDFGEGSLGDNEGSGPPTPKDQEKSIWSVRRFSRRACVPESRSRDRFGASTGGEDGWVYTSAGDRGTTDRGQDY